MRGDRQRVAGAIRSAAGLLTIAGLTFGGPAWAQEGASDEPAAEDAPPVQAPDLGPDEVQLKNGGVVRGTIISFEPGQDVVIQVYGATAPRTIPWAEVADVQRGKHAKKEPEASPPPPPPPEENEEEPEVSENEAGEAAEEPSISEAGVVRVHIEADRPGVQLHEVVAVSTGVVAGGGAFVIGHTRTVCTAPCDKVVDGRNGQRFFFAGDGMTTSGSFMLNDRQGDVTATVDAGSSGLRAGAIATTIIGGTGLAAGVALTVVGYTVLAPEGGEGFQQGMRIGGIVGIGAGAAVLGGGIAMFVLSRTTYQLSDGAPRQARAARWWLGEF